MVQVNLDLSETISLKIGKHVEESGMVLFSGIKVGMSKRCTVEVTHSVSDSTSHLTPLFESGELGALDRVPLTWTMLVQSGSRLRR